MANGGRNDNGSQFFLTLGETRELEGRHTMFGRVVGDTIYNLIKIGEAELEPGEGSDRPVYPTRVTGAEILVNPFEDMIRREVKVSAELGGDKDGGRRKVKKKRGKTLLSFAGDEVEEGAEGPVLKKEKFNPKLVSAGDDSKAAETLKESPKPPAKNIEKTLRRKPSGSRSPPLIAKPNRELQLPLPNEEEPSRSPSTSPEPVEVAKNTSLLDRTNAQIADLKASMKRNVQIAPTSESRRKSALEQMIPENSMRGRKRKHGANGDTGADKQTIKLLNAFRAKLEKALPEITPAKTPAVKDQNKQNTVNGHDKEEANDKDDDEEAELCDLHFIANCQSCQLWDQHMLGDAEEQDDDNQAWMSHALSFEKDRLGKDLTWKKKNEEELVVIDPLEKAKDIREEQRTKKLAKPGARSVWSRDKERKAGEKR